MIHDFCIRIFDLLRVWKYRSAKRRVYLHWSCRIVAGCCFEGYNSIGRDSLFVGRRMGRFSYISKCSGISGNIGRFTSIGPYVHSVVGRHPIKQWGSTSPAFFSPEQIKRLEKVRWFDRPVEWMLHMPPNSMMSKNC